MLTSVIQKIQTVIHHQEVQKNLGWMDTLTNLDELDVLRETTMRLAKIKFDSGDTLKRQLDILLEIDQKTHKTASKTASKYMNALKLNKKFSGDIYAAVYQYQRQLYF
jgi:cell division protein YceG involved in septum cleavage